MKKVSLLIMAAGLAACQTTTQSKGTLTDYSVSSEAYTTAYDQRFSKESDRLGWSQALQLAWSRGATAEVCGLPFNRDAYLDKLARNYTEAGRFLHDLNGLQWHSAQVRKAGNGFCTDERKADAQKYI